MKAIWKGYLKCSLATIPLKMFTATTKRPLQFHPCHKACGSRINQENVCSFCGQTLVPKISSKTISTARTSAWASPEVTFQEETPRGHFRAPAFIRLIE